MIDVHVFDADAPPTLACVRSLGRAGVQVHVHAPQKLTVAGSSRFTAKTHLCPPADRPEDFLAYVREGFTSGRMSAIAPTSDNIAFILAELDDCLPAPLRRVLPDPAAVRCSLFKHEFDHELLRLGFATPKAFYPSSLEALEPLIEQMTYPTVLKPRSHIGVPNERGMVVHSEAELRQHFAKYDGMQIQPYWLAKYPELAWPLIQEYVPGALENLYSISGFIDPDGGVRAISASHKVAQWPPKLGVGTIFESFLEQPIIDKGLELVRRLIGRGLFELELIFDARTSEWLAIDLNPRAFGQMSFDIARGADLPRLWLDALLGRPSAPVQTKDKMVWVHSIPFHVGSAISLMKGPHRWSRMKTYSSMLVRDRVDIVSDWSDPMPSAVFAARMLRHPGGLVRPLWNET